MATKETIVDLTENLVAVKNQLIAGTIELDMAREINNTAGKILLVVKVQLAQQAMILAFESHGKTASAIPYLGSPKCIEG